MKRDRTVLRYRCHECHYLVDKELLFDTGCPICGWISPHAKLSQEQDNDSRIKKYIDIIDNEDDIWITVELPNIDQDCLTIDVDNSTLLISGESIKRIIPLPYSVEDNIESSYKNGVLDLKLQKKRSGYFG